jgi:tRNA-(ms[2]io[6]A)-hydroxylase
VTYRAGWAGAACTLWRARSCERFAALAPRLDPELGSFYTRLLSSEARHFRSYLTAAERAAGSRDISSRIAEFRAREQALIEASDTEFRFHSGPPSMPVAA